MNSTTAKKEVKTGATPEELKKHEVKKENLGGFNNNRNPETQLDIQVQRMYRFESDRPLKAFADIIINEALLVKGIKVLEGKNGLFVSMPQEQAKDKKWYDSVRCLTQEVREQITEAVLEVYKEG